MSGEVAGTPPRTSCLIVALVVLGAVNSPLTAQDELPRTGPLALVEMGANSFMAGDLDTAESRFEEALEQTPNFVPGLLGLFEVHKARGDLSRALETARRAEEANPGILLAQVAVGEMLVRLDAAEEGLRKLSAVLELEPNNFLATLYSAIALRNLHRPDAATELLLAARERGLREPALVEQLGYLYLAAGNPKRAVEIAKPVVAENPEKAGLELVLGLALAEIPELRRQAIEPLRRAIGRGAHANGLARVRLAALLLEENELEDAIVHLRAAESLAPAAPEVQLLLARALRLTGDVSAAEAAERRLAKLGGADSLELPEETIVALREAQALANASRFDEAFETLDPLLAATPDLVVALELKAKLLLALGRPREALTVALAARQGAPGSARLLFLEGLVRSTLGQAVKAESPLRQALEIDPDLGDAHSMLGSSLSRQERPAEAILHFAKAIELGSDSPTLRLGYAAALESLGREEEAKAQMEAYRRLN